MIINGDQLLIVSGIQEYARRLRELRVQFEWAIVSGVMNEELQYVAGDKTEWSRRVRELRTEFGWPIATKSTGWPDLGVGIYVLQADRQSPEHNRSIPDDIRREVLRRDGYKCKECRWSHDEWNPSDPRHLELHRHGSPWQVFRVLTKWDPSRTLKP